MFLNTLPEMVDSPLTCEDMAQFCGLGTTQFSKYCIEITNLTPMKYFGELRLKKAHHLLLDMPRKSITEIAYECGFSSNQYFTLLFKKRYGSSPQAYRESKREKTEKNRW